MKKFLSIAVCLLSVGVLSGCVDDRGYRSGGYYATGVQYRSFDRDRYYRDYDRRNWREQREWRERRDWRSDYRHRPRPQGQYYGIVIR